MGAIKTVGIIGAGKVGIVLAQLALRAGYRVVIAGSGKPEKIALSTRILAPGAEPLTVAEVAKQADVVILALPLSQHTTLPWQKLKNKLIIDAMNYWWETDGIRDDLTELTTSSSERIQAHLRHSIVVKAFNHMGYHDLHDGPQNPGVVSRKAIAVAGDDTSALKTVMDFVNTMGFDPVYAGTLHDSISLEPHSDAFGANVDKQTLETVIKGFSQTERGRAVAEARRLT